VLYFLKFVGKNRVKKKTTLFWGRIPGKLPYFQCLMLTAMVLGQPIAKLNTNRCGLMV